VIGREEEEFFMRIYDPKKILVPVDFSPMSKEVLRAAIEIGKHRDAEVCALHVLRGSEHIAYYAGEFSGAAGMERADEESRILAETQLKNMLNELAAGPKVQARLVMGDPVNEIIQHAEAEDIDLIVMATRGRRGLSRLLMGSVTEQVVRCAPCPVLSIRPKAHQLSPLRFGAEDVAMN